MNTDKNLPVITPDQPNDFRYTLLNVKINEKTYHQVLLAFDFNRVLKNHTEYFVHLYEMAYHGKQVDVYIVPPDLATETSNSTTFWHKRDADIITFAGLGFVNQLSAKQASPVDFELYRRLIEGKPLMQKNDFTLAATAMGEFSSGDEKNFTLSVENAGEIIYTLSLYILNHNQKSKKNKQAFDMDWLGSILTRNKFFDKKAMRREKSREDGSIPDDAEVFDVSNIAISFFKPQQITDNTLNKIYDSYKKYLLDKFKGKAQNNPYNLNSLIELEIQRTKVLPEKLRSANEYLLLIMAEYFFQLDVVKTTSDNSYLLGLATESNFNAAFEADRFRSYRLRTEDSTTVSSLFFHVTEENKNMGATPRLVNNPIKNAHPEKILLKNKIAILLYNHIACLKKSSNPIVFGIVDDIEEISEDVLVVLSWYSRFFETTFQDQNGETYKKKALKANIWYIPEIKKTLFMIGIDLSENTYSNLPSVKLISDISDLPKMFADFISNKTHSASLAQSTNGNALGVIPGAQQIPVNSNGQNTETPKEPVVIEAPADKTTDVKSDDTPKTESDPKPAPEVKSDVDSTNDNTVSDGTPGDDTKIDAGTESDTQDDTNETQDKKDDPSSDSNEEQDDNQSDDVDTDNSTGETNEDDEDRSTSGSSGGANPAKNAEPTKADNSNADDSTENTQPDNVSDAPETATDSNQSAETNQDVSTPVDPADNPYIKDILNKPIIIPKNTSPDAGLSIGLLMDDDKKEPEKDSFNKGSLNPFAS